MFYWGNLLRGFDCFSCVIFVWVTNECYVLNIYYALLALMLSHQFVDGSGNQTYYVHKLFSKSPYLWYNSITLTNVP